MTCIKEGKAGLGPRIYHECKRLDTNLYKMLLKLRPKMTPSSPKMLRTIKVVEVRSFLRKACYLGLIMYYDDKEKKKNSSIFMVVLIISFRFKAQNSNEANGNRWKNVIFKMGLKISFVKL